MALIIPLRTDAPHYTLVCSLDGKDYELELLWNVTANGWFLSLFKSDSTPLVSGIRVVVDWPLGGRFNSQDMPPGLLICQDTAGQQEDPGYSELGARVQMLYFTAAEVAAA